MALLYVDVLGIKARWRTGGSALVTETYLLLEQMLQQALASVGESPRAGGIQSDALGLAFDHTAEAVRVGRTLFAKAFRYSVENPDSPLWLRGVVSPVDKAVPLVVEEPFGDDEGTLTVRRFSDDLLHAINVEQSGTKGVRLLIDKQLLVQTVIDEFAIPVGHHRYLIPLRELDNSIYPEGAGLSTAGYADILWMIPEPISHWKQWEEEDWRLSKALRAAGQQGEQFAQMAATALVFSEVAAILGSVGHRRTGGLPGAPGN